MSPQLSRYDLQPAHMLDLAKMWIFGGQWCPAWPMSASSSECT